MITLENISKTYRVPVRKAGLRHAFSSFFKRDYRTVRALNNITLHIKPGEMVGYIGPNGAGKSTTIKILSGILHPDSGSVMVDGLNPFQSRKKHAKSIGVVFGQRTQLWWDLPVGDSYQLIKEIYKIPQSEFNTRSEELISLFELEDIVTMPVRQLSLGQRVRCDIVASLLHNPKVLFLDEPTIGLDAHSKQRVRELIRYVNQKYKTTVILTTHDMQDIEQIVSRVILIGRGELLYDGELKDLIKQYGYVRQIKIGFSGTLISQESYTIIEATDSTALIQLNSDLAHVIESVQSIVSIQHLEVLNTTIDDVIIKLYEEYQI